MSNYDLYIKQLKNKYRQNNATNDLGLTEEEIDNQANMQASQLEQQGLMKQNQVQTNLPVTQKQVVDRTGMNYYENANQNKIDWAENYEEESLNWWERIGAYITQTFDTLSKGVYKGIEGLVDFGASIVGNIAGAAGNEQMKNDIADWIAQDQVEAISNQEWYKQLKRIESGTWMFGSFDENGYNFGNKALDYSYNEKATDDFTKKIAQGISSSLVFAGYTSLGPVGWGLALGQVAGNSTEQALNDGATLGKATLYGLSSAAIEGISEALVGKVLNVFGKGASAAANKLFGANISGRIANDTIGGIIGKQYGKSILMNMLKEFNEEGLEEVFSDVLDPICKMIYKECDSDNFFENYGKLFDENGGWQGLLESYFYGGMSAVFSGGANTVARIGKYGSIKAVQFENSIANVTELNAEIQEQLKKNDINKYPDPSQNPKIAKLLKRKEYLREKIGNDFKEWLDNVKQEYDEATKEKPVRKLNEKGRLLNEYTTESGETIKGREAKKLAKSMSKEALSQIGQTALDTTVEDLQNDLGREAVEEGVNYKYERTDNVNKINLSKKTIYVKGKQSFREYIKSTIHEVKHAADKGLNNSNLTDEIIKDISKEDYDKEFEKQAILEGDTFLETTDGRNFLRSKNLTLDQYKGLSDEKKIQIKLEAAQNNVNWFNEEVAAEHLIDYFANYNEFASALGLSPKGIRKVLNTFRKAFANTKNRPANYDNVIKALKEGIKTERQAAIDKLNDEERYSKNETKFGNFENTLQKSKKDGTIEESEVDKYDLQRILEENRNGNKGRANSIGSLSSSEWKRADVKGISELSKRLLQEEINTGTSSSRLDIIVDNQGNEYLVNAYNYTYNNLQKLFNEIDAETKQKLSTEHNLEEFKKAKLCLTSADGKSTIAVLENGDIINLLNTNSEVRGFASKALKLAIDNGGIKMDNYNIPLSDNNSVNLTYLYSKSGFIPVSATPYNAEFINETIREEFTKKNQDQPIMFMMYTGTNSPVFKSYEQLQDFIRNEVVVINDWDKASAYRDNNLDNAKEKLKKYEKDDIRYRITDETQELYDDVTNPEKYTSLENTMYDRFARNDEEFARLKKMMASLEDLKSEEEVDGVDIIKQADKYMKKLINTYYIPLTNELKSDKFDPQKVVDLNYYFINSLRQLLEYRDEIIDYAEDYANDEWIEKFDKNLTKLAKQVSKLKTNMQKIDGRIKPHQVENINQYDDLAASIEAQEERETYTTRKEKFEAELTKKKVDVKQFSKTANELGEKIKKQFKKIDVENVKRDSTKKRHYEELVAPVDTLVEQYKITLRDVNISEEDINTAVNYLLNDIYGGRKYRRAREKKANAIRENYERLTLSPNEIVNSVREVAQPVDTNNNPEVRVRFINNSRKVATPDMAGIKAQADLRKDGKVYTLNSVMDLTKAVESSMRNEPLLRDKNVTIDYEGSTRELKSLEIAMVLNEYNNTQYVKEESKQINYSNLTNEEKIDKITSTIVSGITMDYNGTTTRLNTLVEANDRMAIIMQEYIRSQVANLVENEGQVSKITRVLERQAKAFNERIKNLKEKNAKQTRKIVELTEKIEEEKQKGKDKNKELIKKYTKEIKELKKQSEKEANELRKELRKANRKIDTLEEKALRQEELKRKYQRKNMELYTDSKGLKRIKAEDIETLNSLGKNINPDFKMSAYVENQIVQHLARGDFDGAVDIYMNAILNSDYVDGDEAKPYSYFIGDYSYGDDLLLDDGSTFENDIMELRKEMIEIFKGSEISSRGKFIEKMANMATYTHNLRMRLREAKTSLVVYRHAYRASNTAKRVYKKVIDIDKNGGSKSGNRLAGTSPEWVKAILDFVEGRNGTTPLNRMTPDAIINREHKAALEQLLKDYERLEREGLVAFPMPPELKAYIRYVLEDTITINAKYVDAYKRVLNGINRLIENEIGERKIKFGNVEGAIKDVSRRMQDENTLKDGEKEETFSKTQGFITPLAVVNKLARYQEEAVLKQIYEELFNAEMKKEEVDLKLREPFIEFRDKNKKVAKSFFKSLRKQVEITYNGKKITATKAQLLSFYEAFKREQAKGHIVNRLGGIEIGNKVYQFDTEQMLELAKLMEEEKQKGKERDTELIKKYDDEIGNLRMAEIQVLVKAVEKEFNLDNSKSVNAQYLQASEKFFELAREYKKETDIERLGFSNVEDGFYFPIRIANADAQVAISSEDFFSPNMPGAANYSWNKNTTGTMGAIKLLDIDDIIDRYARQMATYAGYGVVTENIRKVWNYKLEGGRNVRQAILSRFVDGDGRKVEKYIARLVNDVQGIGQGEASNTDTLFGKIVNKLRGNVARVALGANPKVMMSQTASIPAAMRYIKGKYLLAAFTRRLKNMPPKPAMLLYRENHELVGQAETQGAIDKAGSIFTKGINYFDKVAIDAIWKACLLQTRNADGSWNIEEATKLAQKTVFDTQPNYLALGRSEFLRSKNDFVKLFTMFQSQAQQNLSMAYDSINRIIYKKRHKLPITSDDWSDLGHALAALFIQALVYTGMGELFKHLIKNDWKDMSFGKSAGDFGIAMINDNIIGMIPLINNLEIDLEKEWKINIEKLGSGFIDNYVDIIQNFQGFDKATIQDWNTALSYVFGLPGTNIYKWTKTFGQYLPNAEDYFDELDINYRGLDLKKGYVTSATKAGNKTLERKYYKQYSKKNGLDIVTANKLYKLYSKTENEKDVYRKVIISAIPEKYTKDGEEIEINKEDFLKTYSKLSGGLNSVMNSKSYAKYTEEQQAKILTKVIDIYYSTSKKAITGDNMNLLEKIVYSGKNIDVDTLYAILEASEIEADEKTSKKDKITKYINKLKLSKANKYFIYAALGYSVDGKLYQDYLTKRLRLTNRAVKKILS